MAQRFENPFQDPIASILARPETNPFLNKMHQAAQDRTLNIRYGSMLKGMQGKWQSEIGPLPHADQNLILEIGCHLGKNLCEFAIQFPHTKFIGADITFKRVYTSSERAGQRKLPNVATILFNAKHLSSVFAPAELSGVVIFFPDPWTKKKTAKHRLLTPEFAKDLYQVVMPGGFVWLKTDQATYFEDARTAIESAGFKEMEQKSNHYFCSQNFESTFERKFRLANQPTFGAAWVR